jgi:hypothetical protein
MFDVIVVGMLWQSMVRKPVLEIVPLGAGVVGSATAYALIKRGLKVLLLEQVWLCISPLEGQCFTSLSV